MAGSGNRDDLNEIPPSNNKDNLSGNKEEIPNGSFETNEVPPDNKNNLTGNK